MEATPARRLYIGKQDASLAENQQFAAQLTAARMPNTFSVFDGSHLPSFYRSHLPLAVEVASSRLKTTPRPAGAAGARSFLPHVFPLCRGRSTSLEPALAPKAE